MAKGLVVSAFGKDRPGIVGQLTGVVFQEGGNLEDSRMAILGGEFALIVLVTGSSETLARLKETLPHLASHLQLTVQARDTELADKPHRGDTLPYRLTAVAVDHPGIVHRITKTLALHEVNVAALETRLTPAPSTGTPVFSLVIETQIPTNLSIAKLRAELEAIADEENLDLEFHALT